MLNVTYGCVGFDDSIAPCAAWLLCSLMQSCHACLACMCCVVLCCALLWGTSFAPLRGQVFPPSNAALVRSTAAANNTEPTESLELDFVFGYKWVPSLTTHPHPSRHLHVQALPRGIVACDVTMGGFVQYLWPFLPLVTC
jgi:hypothetical protein